MLIYNNIEKIRKERKIPKMEFYKAIGMTDTGYRQAKENNSLKVITLEKIANVLQCRMSDLLTSDADGVYDRVINIGVESMAKTIKENEAKINMLNTELLDVYRQLNEYKNQIIELQKSTNHDRDVNQEAKAAS
jgi:DNA-binding Xre family transcriptional regulator